MAMQMDAPGEHKPAPEQAAPQPEMAMMPDMMGDSSNKGLKKIIPIPIWLLIILIIVFSTPYYFIHKISFNKGFDSLFKSNINSMRKKTKFSNASFPINKVVVNLRDYPSQKYVVLSFQLNLREDIELNECIMREAELRDLTILYLSRFQSAELDSLVELQRFKRLIKDEMNASLKEARITDIYFIRFEIRTLKSTQEINPEN